MPCAVAACAALGKGSVREADEERQPNPRMLMKSTSRKRGASERACLRRFSMAHLHYVLFYYYHTFMYQYMINAREPGFSNFFVISFTPTKITQGPSAAKTPCSRRQHSRSSIPTI